MKSITARETVKGKLEEFNKKLSTFIHFFLENTLEIMLCDSKFSMVSKSLVMLWYDDTINALGTIIHLKVH
jgi:hypothetical protein